MTVAQQSRVNAALRSSKDVRRWLSPRQRRCADVVTKLLAKQRMKLLLLPTLEDFDRAESALRGLDRSTGVKAAGKPRRER